MRRIVIFGNSGSGKSTLARAYCARPGLAHLDLDSLAWEPTQPPVRRPLPESGADIRSFIRSNREWVIEGCYADLLVLVVPEATAAVFLNPGLEQCVANCRTRPWEPHKYPSQEAQDRNLPMLIEWVEQYYERADEFSFQAHRALYDAFRGEKSELRANAEVTEHLGAEGGSRRYVSAGLPRPRAR